MLFRARPFSIGPLIPPCMIWLLLGMAWHQMSQSQSVGKLMYATVPTTALY